MYAHPQCYASRLGSCSREISSEHYISYSVLKKLDQKTITIRENGRAQTYTAKRFAFEVLCTTHNNELNSLDTVAKSVVAALLKFNNEIRYSNPKVSHRAMTVRGWDFERWIVKAYCGMNAAGHLGKPWPIPEYMIDTLFRGARLPMDLGLYMAGRVGDLVNIGKTIQFQPLRRQDTGEPCRLLLELRGVVFHFSLAPARDGRTGKVDGRDRHVPGIVFNDQNTGFVRELNFDWS